MKRLHVHVAVPNLEQSIRFYSTLFGAEPEKKRLLLRLWLTAREFEDGDERLRQGFTKAEVA